MKKVRFKRFDGSRVALLILLIMFLLPGIVYWVVKRREFIFDVLTEDELVEELEKLHNLAEKSVIDKATFEEKRDRLVKLCRKANKAADKRKPKPKILTKYQNKIVALNYVIKSIDKIDVVGKESFNKALKKL